MIVLWIICGVLWGKELFGYSRRKKNREHLNPVHALPYSKCKMQRRDYKDPEKAIVKTAIVTYNERIERKDK